MNENLKMALERHLVVCIQYTYVSTKNFLNNSDFIFFKVNSGHQRSNLGHIRPIGVKSGRLVEIYQIYICFNSEFSRRLKFKIIKGQIRSYKVIKGQNWVKFVDKEANRTVRSNCIQHTYVLTQHLVKKSNSRWFEVKSGSSNSNSEFWRNWFSELK